MSLHTDIQQERTLAMKARDEVRLRTLRGLLSAFTDENVAQKQKPDTELSDDEALKVITREAKKRRDSIEQFEKGGRDDLADKEKEELAVLEEFLPEQMSENETRSVVEAKKKELGVTDKSDMGQLMGAVMQELKGKADGNAVKKIVNELLS